MADRILAREISRSRTERHASDVRATHQTRLKQRLPELIPDRTTVPEGVAAEHEIQCALARRLGELPDSLREPFLLIVADGYRNDVAAMEGLTTGEISRRVASATRILRDLLAVEYGENAPPPEQLFRLVERLSPTAVAATRARKHLDGEREPAYPANT